MTDAHRHPLTEDMKHALDWSAGSDPLTTSYVHEHPHEEGHGEPVEPVEEPESVQGPST